MPSGHVVKHTVESRYVVPILRSQSLGKACLFSRQHAPCITLSRDELPRGAPDSRSVAAKAPTSKCNKPAGKPIRRTNRHDFVRQCGNMPGTTYRDSTIHCATWHYCPSLYIERSVRLRSSKNVVL